MRKDVFIRKSTCYRLTWVSRLLVLSFFLFCFFAFVKLVPRFLSINKPIGGQILVLDGQMPDYIVKEAIGVFNEGGYELIVTTGSNLSEGYYLSGMKTMAELTRGTFIALGVDSSKVVALPTKFVKRNRTFNSANTLKEWIDTNPYDFDKIDVLTVGCHARRSYFLFKQALGENKNVGVIALDHRGYDTDTWWKSSIGTRLVISETIAFLYVFMTQ